METKEYTVKTNDVNLHVAEMGEGPLVILCHGFPELGYSWRHQLKALAEAGYRVAAPDQRGYGRSDCPESIEAYDIFQLTGDIVGLVHALGEEQAVIAGHDWGAMVAWHSALFRPDMFRALMLLSVPYTPRQWGDIPPTEIMKMLSGDQVFYISYFQEPGKAEKDLEADVEQSVRAGFYSLSGSAPPEKRWRFVFGKDERLSDTWQAPEVMPDWVSEEEVALFTEAFQLTGYRGGINYYRNYDRNWALTPFLSGARIIQPTLFVAGESDAVITMMMGQYDSLETNVPNLTKKVLIPGAGHWVQQEAPDRVNELMIEFLGGL